MSTSGGISGRGLNPSAQDLSIGFVDLPGKSGEPFRWRFTQQEDPMGKRGRRIFMEGFRQEAVRLTEAIGRTVTQVADDLGVGLRAHPEDA